MKPNFKKKNNYLFTSCIIIVLSGCLTAHKVDKFVARQYGNQLPREIKPHNNTVLVNTDIPLFSSNNISSSVAKTSHVLPLLFYWQLDYKITCILNPEIAVRKFSDAVYAEARSRLIPKLNGDQLQITIDHIPNSFAWDDKGHLIWVVIYAFGWDRIAIKPQAENLIVSYKLVQQANTVKSGTITIPDREANRGVRMFQSWKNATSSYIAQYNHDINTMARLCVHKLSDEL